ncbi:hypothetical protein VTJ04DRAFT_10353 [Mycothermus thermophilus]|uniref:uncharacterized protein n=1 Tax=Humicola insolens TaxID=85995 RepID=UPI003742A90E
MCYYDQEKWDCGWWKWSRFRYQCSHEHRMGETCGLKLINETIFKTGKCKKCEDKDRKERRLAKMNADIDRWQREGGRWATIERTENERQQLINQINALQSEHDARMRSLR